MKRALKIIGIIILVLVVLGGNKTPKTNNCTGAVYPNKETSPYVLPFEVGTERNLSQSNCDGFHNDLDWFGYDFDMPIGTPIFAARGGTVTWVQDQYEDGDHDFYHANTIMITHSDGTSAQYIHLTKNGSLVEQGQRVVQGQRIGISGFTGMTGSRKHLHFIVFEYINEKSRKSLPITFRNVSEPQPLKAGRSYRALPY